MGNGVGGKYLEKAVQDYFNSIKRPTFRYRRLQDSTSARNLIHSNPADFFVCDNGNCFYLECKSVSSKTFRLPKPTQLPELLAWDKAGLPSWFLVHFHIQDVLTWVSTSGLDPTASSYDLSSYKMFSKLSEAIGI